jgi:hypothetical protein
VLKRFPFNFTNFLGRIAFTLFYKDIELDKSSGTIQVAQSVFCFRGVRSDDINLSLCFETFCTVEMQKKDVFTRHFNGFEWKSLCGIQSEECLVCLN